MPHPERSVIFQKIHRYKTVIELRKTNGVSAIAVTAQDAGTYLPLSEGRLGALGGESGTTIKRFDSSDQLHRKIVQVYGKPIKAVIHVSADEKQELLDRMKRAKLRNEGTILLT